MGGLSPYWYIFRFVLYVSLYKSCSISTLGRRDYRGGDFRDRFDRRRSPHRRHSPDRDSRGHRSRHDRRAVSQERESSYSRSPSRKRYEMHSNKWLSHSIVDILWHFCHCSYFWLYIYYPLFLCFCDAISSLLPTIWYFEAQIGFKALSLNNMLKYTLWNHNF